MAIQIDPAGRELRLLRRLVRWRGRRVVEIGCGSGRLTLRLASFRPASIDALDPDRKQLARGRAALPRRHARLVSYRVGRAESLPYRAAEFDCAIFAWAL
jgi:ubiquinone/menaquinone biosynthesis C-methylase UbiE